jgi:hypothetical protein
MVELTELIFCALLNVLNHLHSNNVSNASQNALPLIVRENQRTGLLKRCASEKKSAARRASLLLADRFFDKSFIAKLTLECFQGSGIGLRTKTSAKCVRISLAALWRRSRQEVVFCSPFASA